MAARINPFTGQPFGTYVPQSVNTNFKPSEGNMYPPGSSSYSVPRGNDGGSSRRRRTAHKKRKTNHKSKRVHHSHRKHTRRHRRSHSHHRR